MKKILFILCNLILISFTQAKEFEVTSNPVDSDVFAVNEAGKKTALGKTPFKMDLESLKIAHGQGDVVNISVSKLGFESYNVVVPLLTSTEVKINASLEVEKDLKFTQDFDLLTTDLFDVLRMMRGKDYNAAFDKLGLLEKKFPHFSIIYEMKGAVLYMRNDYTSSLNYYRKAFGINPQNREAFKMKTYLEKKFGINESQVSNGVSVQ